MSVLLTERDFYDLAMAYFRKAELDEIVQLARNAFTISWLEREDRNRYLDALNAYAEEHAEPIRRSRHSWTAPGFYIPLSDEPGACVTSITPWDFGQYPVKLRQGLQRAGAAAGG